MTDDPTRIPVPTNGRGPTPEGASDAAAVTSPTAGAAASEAALDRPPAVPRGVPPGVAAGTDLRIAFTPAQVAKGFAVVAGLLAVVLGIRRRRGH